MIFMNIVLVTGANKDANVWKLPDIINNNDSK